MDSCNWCAATGEMQSFDGQLFCDEQCAEDYFAEWNDDGSPCA